MSILVSGCDGFLGTNLLFYFDQIGINCTKISRRKEFINKSDIIFMELNDMHTIHNTDLGEYDCYINLAGQTSGRSLSLSNFVDANFSTLHSILSNPTFTPKKIIHASSQVVYQNSLGKPLHEIDPFTQTGSNYALSKILAEQYLSKYAENHLCSIYSLRLPGFFDGGGLVTHMINNAKKNEDLIIWGTGLTKRQYMSRRSFCKAVELALMDVTVHGYEAFNLGSKNLKTVYDTAKIITSKLKSQSKIILSTQNKSKATDIDLDLTKAMNILGFDPEDFETSVKEACLDD